jgi:hypothetical protein
MKVHPDMLMKKQVLGVRCQVSATSARKRAQNGKLSVGGKTVK